MKKKLFFTLLLSITVSIVLMPFPHSHATVKVFIEWDGDASFESIGSYPTSPLPAFDANDLNSGWSDDGTEETNMINTITSMVEEDYFDFDLSVVSTKPTTGNYLYVGMGSDVYTSGSFTYFGVGYLNNLSTDMDYARLWSGSFATLSEFQGTDATVDRFNLGLSGTLSHEMGHTYGLEHPDAVLLPGETYAEPGELPELCEDGNHIMSTGTSAAQAGGYYVSMEERATLSRHFGTTNYKFLGLNIGLKFIHLTNSDFVNTNDEDAHDMHIHFYSTLDDLDDPANYSVTFGFGQEWHGRRNPFQDFTTTAYGEVPSADLPQIVQDMGGTWYEYSADWSNPDVAVSEGYMIHLGVSYGGADIFVFDAYFTDISGDEMPSRPVLLAHDSTYSQPDVGGDGDYSANLYNLSNRSVLIENLSFKLRPRLLRLDDLVFDPSWNEDPDWTPLCEDPGPYITTASMSLLPPPCGVLEAGEKQEIFIATANALLKSLYAKGPKMNKPGVAADCQGSDCDIDYVPSPIPTPNYLTGLFPDTYVQLQYEATPFDPLSGTFDFSNTVRQAVELAGVNPLGAPQMFSVTPSEGYRGESVEVTITGSNFLGGANVEVSGSGINVPQVTVEDPNTIKALFVIDISAPATARDVRVLNPHDQSAVLAGAFQVLNTPPDCSDAHASSDELWPPNHKYVDVHILGVSDPDGDPVTITVNGITQDEPVDAAGKRDGKTSPDGMGVGTNIASVKAERQGKGNGRVYEISFTAMDDQGAECSGVVQVCVPHDKRPGHVCIDDGQNYDSTETN